MGYEPTFFGCDGMDGILDVKNFDTSLAEGLMLLTPFVADADDEKTQAFVSKYKELYGDIHQTRSVQMHMMQFMHQRLQIRGSWRTPDNARY